MEETLKVERTSEDELIVKQKLKKREYEVLLIHFSHQEIDDLVKCHESVQREVRVKGSTNLISALLGKFAHPLRLQKV